MNETIENRKIKYELTTKGKIILGAALLIIIGIIIYFVIPKGKPIEKISLDMVDNNQGSIVYDPINGNSVKLEIAKKIQLSVTIYPEKHKNVDIEYAVEDESIAYVNSNNMIVGKKVGNTRVYAKTNDSKIVSNYINVEVTY